MKKLAQLEAKIKQLEAKLASSTYDTRAYVQSELKDRSDGLKQNTTLNGLYTALVLETNDPWGMGRIRFFCPAIHNPKEPIKSFPWAFPTSPFGGFDDSGCFWPPPAGSTVCLFFENGARNCAYYFGTTWHRNRGPAGQHNWNINIEEYYKYWEGDRKGYLCGPNDESQVLPPWNTENYNAFDINSKEDFDENPEAQKKRTIPHVMGFKSPGKHAVKLSDGHPDCNRSGKRFELISGDGNYFIMKDDHLHTNTFAHPSAVGGSQIECVDEDGNPLEKTECQGESSNGSISGGHPNYDDKETQKGSNQFFKHENELRPHKGPGTPQNNKFALPQSGMQLLSLAGHTVILDDSVEEPSDSPGWERSTKDFDFGCNNVFAGKIHIISATGHSIKMSDKESDSQLRGEDNGISLDTACGNFVHLIDHTVPQKDCPGSPPNVGGKERGVKIGSTAKHLIHLCDEDNEQSAPCRKDGGEPIAKGKKTFVLIRTGYGIETEYNDGSDQTKTDNQYYQIFCPQKDNKKRGPHIFRMQEKKEGKGLVFLRTGGDYVISVNDDMVEIVGDPEKNPSDKTEIISRKKLIYTKDNYINITNKNHYFIADENIYFMNGKDCDGTNGPGPCVGNVLVYVNGCVRLSDRIFATASKTADPASIFMFDPLIECPK